MTQPSHPTGLGVPVDIDFLPPATVVPPAPPAPPAPPSPQSVDATPPPHRRYWAFLLVAGLVALALAIVSITQMGGAQGGVTPTGGPRPGVSPVTTPGLSSPASPSVSPTATPGQAGSSATVSTAWRGPLSLSDTNSMASIWLLTNDTAVVFNGTDALNGVDLNSLQVIWSMPLDTSKLSNLRRVPGDETGLVLMLDDRIVVLDPRTGATIGQAKLTPRPAGPSTGPSTAPVAPVVVAPGDAPPPDTEPLTPPTGDSIPSRETPPIWENLYWAGDGLLLMGNDSAKTVCVATMKDPGKCVWTAPDLWTPDQNWAYQYTRGTTGHVFGGGKWVNTGSGVRDLATGKRASFGRDAGVTRNGLVYYTGPSPDRVFRMTTPPPAHSGPGTAQPWNITANKGVSPAVAGNVVQADASSPVFVAQTVDASMSSTMFNPTVAYSWANGQELWRSGGLFGAACYWKYEGMFDAGCLPSNLVGGLFVTYWVYADLIVFDATTGQQLWRDANQPLPAVLDHRLFIATDVVTAFDISAGLTQLWTVEPPEPFLNNIGNFFATPGHIFLITGPNTLWVMDV